MMSSYEENKTLLNSILDLLSAHFGSDVEFVIHDLSLDYEHTVVDIRNGEVTGRKEGNAGDILGLEVIRNAAKKNTTYYNRISYTPEGKTLKSSTLFLVDHTGKPTICIGVNEDITQAICFEKYLRNRNIISTAPAEDDFRGDVSKMLQYLMDCAQMDIGKNTALMNKEEKIRYIQYLDEHGAFLIAKSSIKVCEALGISKYTLYNYLDIVRKNNKP